MQFLQYKREKHNICLNSQNSIATYRRRKLKNNQKEILYCNLKKKEIQFRMR